MIFALVGNQNCGKTTIFNEITNMNQRVGNFPGVTVENVIGEVPKIKNCQIVDLPGLYSLNTYTKEETVTREFILKAKPDVIINVIDSNNLERNLYLTMQLKELGIPIVIGLNMLNEFKANGGKIDLKQLSYRLNIPIVPLTNINKNEIQELIEQSLIQAKKIYTKINYIEQKNKEEIIKKYNEIEKVCNGTVIKPKKSKEKNKTYKIDKILTNKFLGIPIFIAIMIFIFYLTFNVIGEYGTELINKGIEIITCKVENILIEHNVNQIIRTLIIDGVFNGIGSVLSFLPIIVTLYFCLSILEDSGYMARIAFIMDKPLSKIGLSGKSIVPILLGFGCSVPAILSIRTIQSEKERKLTMMLVPFISCSAKIPIYAVFISIFFKQYSAIFMIIIYILGVILGITITSIIKKRINSGNQSTFIIELPNYRLPSIKNTWHLMWNKTKEFIEKAFSIIFVSSIIIWFLKSFDINLCLVHEDNSMLAQIGKKIAPIFSPLGFKDWRIATALIVGISAKEAVISTLSILTNTTSNLLQTMLGTIFTPSSTLSFLIFVLLYTPCIASISIIKKEFGLKTSIKISLNQFLIAYIMAFIIYNLSNLFFYFF